MSAYDDYEPPVQEGLYHKFEDGTEYHFRIIDEPVTFINSFTNKGSGEVRDSFKYAWLVWNLDLKRIQLLQLPVTAFKMIQKYATNPEYGDVTKYNLAITRTGKAPRVTYTVIASPKKSEIPEHVLAAELEFDLIELIKKDETNSNVMRLRDAAAAQKKEQGESPANAPSETTAVEEGDGEDATDEEW